MRRYALQAEVLGGLVPFAQQNAWRSVVLGGSKHSADRSTLPHQALCLPKPAAAPRRGRPSPGLIPPARLTVHRHPHDLPSVEPRPVHPHRLTIGQPRSTYRGSDVQHNGRGQRHRPYPHPLPYPHRVPAPRTRWPVLKGQRHHLTRRPVQRHPILAIGGILTNPRQPLRHAPGR